MQVEPAQQRGMTSVKQRIEQDMRLLPNGVARIHARCADDAHNPKKKGANRLLSCIAIIFAANTGRFFA